MRYPVALTLVGLNVAAAAWGASTDLVGISADGDTSPVCANLEARRAFEINWHLGQSIDLPVYYVRGWSFGIILANSGGAASSIALVSANERLATAGPNGGRPSFEQINCYAAGDSANVAAGSSGGSSVEGSFDAVTQAVVLDYDQVAEIPATVATLPCLDLELLVTGTDAGSTSLVFSDGVGSPPIAVKTVIGSPAFPAGEIRGIAPTVRKSATVAILDPRAPACVIEPSIIGDTSDACPRDAIERVFAAVWRFPVSAFFPSYDVRGWSFALLLENAGEAGSFIKNAWEHEDLATAGHGGARPSFTTINYYAAGDLATRAATSEDATGVEGTYVAVTHAVVLDYDQVAAIPAPAAEVGSLRFAVVLGGTDAGITVVRFAEGIGTPPAATEAVLASPDLPSGELLRVVPQKTNGITVHIRGAYDQPCRGTFTYETDDPDAPGNILKPQTDVGAASVIRSILLRETPRTSSDPATDVQSFSITMAVPSSITVAVALGAGAHTAEYFECAPSDGCVTAAAIMEYDMPLNSAHVLHAATPVEVFTLAIETVPADWSAVPDPAALTLPLAGSCGGISYGSTIVIDAREQEIDNPGFRLLQRVEPVSAVAEFLRGDTNADRKCDVADVVFLLSYLFRDGRTPVCFEAANGNNDGILDIADCIFSLSYLFREGAAPSLPFPTCGPDPAPADSLGCADYPACPTP